MGQNNCAYPLLPQKSRCIIGKGEILANLDNFDNANGELHTVQMTREMTTSNGCHVSLVFPAVSRPGVRRKIAEMFLAALEKGTGKS